MCWVFGINYAEILLVFTVCVTLLSNEPVHRWQCVTSENSISGRYHILRLEVDIYSVVAMLISVFSNKHIAAWLQVHLVHCHSINFLE